MLFGEENCCFQWQRRDPNLNLNSIFDGVLFYNIFLNNIISNKQKFTCKMCSEAIKMKRVMLLSSEAFELVSFIAYRFMI
jgi:hypothetical protein